MSASIQDCAIIAAAFEKGAHFSNNEQAVFAPLTRGIQSTKSFARVSQKTLGVWQGGGTRREGSRPGAGDLETISFDSPLPSTGTPEEGASRLLNAVGITSPEGQARAEAMARDCFPCIGRIENLLSWGPTKSLIDIFLLDIQNRLRYLGSLDELITQGLKLPYGGLCDLLALLSRMCPLDLQKILFLLSALNVDFSINLEGLMPMLRGLLAPLVAPPLANLNGIVDQLASLVFAVMDCFIELLTIMINDLNAIQAAGRTVARGAGQIGNEVVTIAGARGPPEPSSVLRRGIIRSTAEESVSIPRGEEFGATSALVELRNQLKKSKQSLEEKALQIKKWFAGLIGAWRGMDDKYMGFALDRLINIRLIGIIIALIKFRGKYDELCPEGRDPNNQELNLWSEVFFKGPVKMIFTEDGDIKLEEKFDYTPTSLAEDIGEFRRERVLGLPQEDQVAMTLVSPAVLKIPCRLRTSQSDVSRVNLWMSQLNAAT